MKLDNFPRYPLTFGPSPVHPRVTRALAAPALGHLDPALLQYLQETSGLLRSVFRTQNPTTLVMNANKSVTASFTVTYTLSVSIRRKGSVTLNPPGGIYLAGTQVTLTAVPGSGYIFDRWDGALTGSANPATLLINGNKSVTATFRRP